MKYKILIFSFFHFFIFSFSFAQQSRIDSLENRLNTELSDTVRIHILNNLSSYYTRNEHDKALAKANEALKLSEKISYNSGKIISLFNIALVYQYETDYMQSVEKLLSALKLCEQEADSFTVMVYNSIANNYALMERRDEALEYYEKALALSRKINFRKSEATILGNMGNIIYYKSYDNAKQIFDTAMLNRAMENYNQAIKIHTANRDSQKTISPMLNTALVQIELGKHQEALKTLSALKILCQKTNDVANLVYVISNTARAYMKMKQYSEGLNFYNDAIELARSISDKNIITDCYVSISELFAEQKNYEKAYEYYIKYSVLRDSILNEENSRSVSEMQTKYETEKKEKQIEMQALELNKKQIFIYAVSAGLLLMFALAFFIYRGYRHKQKANQIISKQKREVELQKILIEEKNKNITDSILYASRIQHTILPDDDFIEKLLPAGFLFYRPRDIVSGDFYWFSEKNEQILIAVADCTGHGVPGALMSVAGSSLLHQIVSEKTTPSEILSELDKQIIGLLKQKGIEGESREGMDIALVSLRFTDSKTLMQFSGANRPLFILHKEELKEIEGSKYPVGSIYKSEKKFQLNEIPLEKGDCFYITTDGFTDQFGGKTNKKFMTRRFKESLLNIHSLTMKEQKITLTKIIDEWKGNNEQVDDITVIGVRV